MNSHATDSGHSAKPMQSPVSGQSSSVSRQQHEQAQGHRGSIVWLTGLPGSGKTTLAYGVEARLHAAGYRCAVLDGDDLRQGLSADLGFSMVDRNESVRRTGEVARLLLTLGTVVLVALVSPVRKARDRIRHDIQARGDEADFMEVYCCCPLVICRGRDPKGLYRRAGQGLIAEFTGVSSPYEAPLAPALTLDTGRETEAQCIDRLVTLILSRNDVRSKDKTAGPGTD